MNDNLAPILLVEDRPSDIDLTKRAFARSRLLNPIEVARDGEEALYRSLGSRRRGPDLYFARPPPKFSGLKSCAG
jgi:hypothetical protein